MRELRPRSGGTMSIECSSGAFTRLPADALAEILDAAGSAIDARGGTVTVPYATLAIVTGLR